MACEAGSSFTTFSNSSSREIQRVNRSRSMLLLPQQHLFKTYPHETGEGSTAIVCNYLGLLGKCVWKAYRDFHVAQYIYVKCGIFK